VSDFDHVNLLAFGNHKCFVWGELAEDGGLEALSSLYVLKAHPDRVDTATDFALQLVQLVRQRRVSHVILKLWELEIIFMFAQKCIPTFYFSLAGHHRLTAQFFGVPLPLRVVPQVTLWLFWTSADKCQLSYFWHRVDY